jgi:hypothetical protein
MKLHLLTFQKHSILDIYSTINTASTILIGFCHNRCVRGECMVTGDFDICHHVEIELECSTTVEVI